MLINYFKIAWRNLMKSKVFSFINVFGLAAGLTCCMLISLYLIHETSYDSYQKDVQDLYQIGTVFSFQHQEHVWAATPAPMAATMEKEFPEIVQTARIMQLASFEDKTLLQYKGTTGAPAAFYETKGFLADSTFFRLFTYNFIEGDPQTALDRSSTVVLSEEVAGKLFGNTPALGKLIHVSSTRDGEHDFMVTGVFRPMDHPSHIDANFFLSMRGGDFDHFLDRQANDFATNNLFSTYLQLRPGSDPDLLAAKFPAFMDKYAGKDMKTIGFEKRQFLVPVRDIHLRSDIEINVTPAASKASLYILASIAIFTLLIACINFMNLATARSAKRSAEVGVRKVLGAGRTGLMGQFLGESVLMSVIAFCFAWLFTVWLLPAFSQMTDRTLHLSFPGHWPLLGTFLGLAVLAGLLAGLYPAIYLSSFQPAKVLKGKFVNSLAAVSLRKGLVVFQFVISVTLIVSTVIINDQMHYMRTQDLGFTKDEQIVVPTRSATSKQLAHALESEFRQVGGVIDAGSCTTYPGIPTIFDFVVHRNDHNANDQKRIRLNYVDYAYMRTQGLTPVAGRLYSESFPGDTLGRFIINESAVQLLGYPTPDAAIGQKVSTPATMGGATFEIVGVVKDFHFEDLSKEITPYGFMLVGAEQSSYVIVHTRSGNHARVVAALADAWKKLDPNEPFEYSFLDQDFQKNYASEERLSSMIRYFTVMAILISCLGLFGLASFSAEQRIREIGIRKVLGANVAEIVMLLSKDFIKLVAIAAVIASPLAWWIMHKWLADFAYRTPIHWTVFAITLLTTLLITLVTISFQAIRAGLANPIKSLKTE